MRQTATARLLRNVNRAAILDLIREQGPIARPEIARRLQLSLPTVMRLVDGLLAEDLVRAEGRGEGAVGRPSSLVAFNGNAYGVVGVDLGGTKMFGTLANLAGVIEHEVYMAHGEADGPAGDVLGRLCALIEALLAAPRPEGQRIRGIGVGAPGFTLSEEGVVLWAPSLGWRDVPLKRILSERFGLPVFVENDVNLAALGEWGFGAGRGVQDLVCIAIGTGVGAGVIINGSLYHGHHKAAGEVGYLVPGVEFLGWPGDGFGALESQASGTGVAERARRRLQQMGRAAPEGLTAEDVFAAARQGEEWAQDVVQETVDYLSLAIAGISAILDPELIVLGGGVARSADLLIEPILQRLKGTLLFEPRLVASTLGYRAAVMGAIMKVLYGTTEHVVVNRPG